MNKISRKRFLGYLGLGSIASTLIGLPLGTQAHTKPKLRSIYKGSIAGYFYSPAGKANFLPQPQEKLKIQREANNRYDHYAMALYAGSIKLGYISRADNRTLAKLMDAGYNLVATVSKVDTHNGRLQPDIRFWIEIEEKLEIQRKKNDT